jgi:superfamily II DNA or RNA helicase
MTDPFIETDSEQISDPRFAAIFEALQEYEHIFPEDFASEVFRRGMGYAESGQVESVSISKFTPKELRIHAVVEGSERYAVSIKLKVNKFGINESCTCSCPYGSSCKHAAATLCEFFDATWSARLLAYVKAGEEGGMPVRESAPELGSPMPATATALAETSQKPLAMQCEKWLDTIAASAVELPPPRMIPRYDLGYLLTLATGARSGALVEWSVVPALLSHAQPNTPIVTRGEDIRWMSAAGGVSFQPDDAQILIGLRVLALEQPSYRNAFSYSATPSTCKDGDLLLKAISTGRCFLSGVAPTQLSIGPQQKVRLIWERTVAGTLCASLSGLSPDACVLSTESGSFYLNRKTGCIGEVVAEEGTISPQVWLKTPRVKPAQALSLAIAARKKGLPVDGLEDVTGNGAIPQLGTPQVVVRVFATTRQVPSNQWQWRVAADSHSTVANFTEKLPYLHAIAVAFRYGEIEVSASSQQQIFPAPATSDAQILRNSDYEKRAINRLLSLGTAPLASQPHTHRLETRGLYGVRTQYEDYLTELLRFVRKLQEQAQSAGWTVSVPSYLVPIDVPESAWGGTLVQSEEGSWFDAELSVEAQGQRIDLGEILVRLLDQQSVESSAIRGSQKERVLLALPDCCVELDRERLVRLTRLVEELANRDSGKALRFDRYAAYAFENALQGALGKWESPDAIGALRERIARIEQRAALPEPRQFEGTLRDYQQQGLSWLSAISNAELGGILADDMGLGKTVQLIALMLQERSQKRVGVNLVVCPKSVEPNWIAELARFAPSLRVRRATGAGRIGADEQLSDADVVVTTYPILLRDAAALSKIDFNIAIFDEAQHIKNPSTASYQAARAIKARIKFPVSGTPIENNLKDLWAHFNLMMPGFLSSLSHFQEVYRKPIEKHGDDELRQHLAARIRPFILRRTKAEVAKELPPLTEIVQRCALEGAQRDLYETIRQLTTKKVREALASKGAKRSHIEFLDALLKLRQACCDPALVKTAAAKKVKLSAKRATLMELLLTLLAEERSVIIFSQFTSMLTLIEEEIRQQQIPYVLLTGDSADRETPVKAFQSGEARVFLMSLKAGGVGINLTAADAIIIYDPWWNPAVEAQAICRAHRIGQKKPVFAYRLIAEGTVEERILELQAKKRSLVENILTENERPPELTNELIDYLFAPIGE